MLDHQESRRDHLENEAERRERTRGSPDDQFLPLTPDAQMNSGPLDRGRQFREGVRGER